MQRIEVLLLVEPGQHCVDVLGIRAGRFAHFPGQSLSFRITAVRYPLVPRTRVLGQIDVHFEFGIGNRLVRNTLINRQGTRQLVLRAHECPFQRPGPGHIERKYPLLASRFERYLVTDGVTLDRNLFMGARTFEGVIQRPGAAIENRKNQAPPVKLAWRRNGPVKFDAKCNRIRHRQ